jgi:threonyl-tRNA synthetase
MHGIIRTRGFTQNDAHLYMRMDQLEDEIISVVQLNEIVYAKMGVKNYWFRLSLPDFEGHPEKYSGDRERWEMAAEALRSAMKKMKKEYVETKDEAAFYGPKIDIQSKNIMGKEDTIATVQVDILVPKRLGLFYIDEKDEKAIPVVIHRAILGSYERFIAFLLEQTMGKFPVWLAPVQVKVLPLSEKFKQYAHEIFAEMQHAGIRVQLDDSDGTLNYRIREAQIEKVPYMVIVGEKEQAAQTVSIRTREGTQENAIPRAKWMERLKKEVEEMK